MAKAKRVSVFRSEIEKIEENTELNKIEKVVEEKVQVTVSKEKVILSEEKNIIKDEINTKSQQSGILNFDFLNKKINKFLVDLIKMT